MKDKEIRTLVLEKKAQGSGGDRYQEVPEESALLIIGKMYVLQTFSRKDGPPLPAIKITIEKNGGE